ncbi:MAG: hypothetical protein ABJH05_16275 [Fulvivirga sp.]
MKYLKSLLTLAIGLFIIYWAQSHSPEAGVGDIISNELSGSYTMSSTWYYISMVAGSVITIFGVLKLYKDLK